jgi:oligopeptidase B
MTGGGPVLPSVEMDAGHGGKPGRFGRLEEAACNMAFAIVCVSGALSDAGT